MFLYRHTLFKKNSEYEELLILGKVTISRNCDTENFQLTNLSISLFSITWLHCAPSDALSRYAPERAATALSQTQTVSSWMTDYLAQ